MMSFAFVAALLGTCGLNGHLPTKLHSLMTSHQEAPFVHIPKAMQRIYTSGVPHTDRRGNRMMQYERNRSFLPLVLYDAAVLAPSTRYALHTNANFTAVLPYGAWSIERYMDEFATAGLQVIRESPTYTQPDEDCKPSATKSCENEVQKYRNHPSILGWYIREEPTGRYFGQNISGQFNKYTEEVAKIKAIDPHHPVFALDTPSIFPPTTQW
eukprot:COSAG06_NODE_349_length_16992_cov_9.318712_10_plen_212_part_00